jgi:hypothetical protein
LAVCSNYFAGYTDSSKILAKALTDVQSAKSPPPPLHSRRPAICSAARRSHKQLEVSSAGGRQAEDFSEARHNQYKQVASLAHRLRNQHHQADYSVGLNLVVVCLEVEIHQGRSQKEAFSEALRRKLAACLGPAIHNREVYSVAEHHNRRRRGGYLAALLRRDKGVDSSHQELRNHPPPFLEPPSRRNSQVPWGRLSLVVPRRATLRLALKSTPNISVLQQNLTS